MVNNRSVLRGITYQRFIYSDRLTSNSVLDNLNINTISGPVIADLNTEQTSYTDNKIITPAQLAIMLTKPFPIGLEEPNTGAFTTMSLETALSYTNGGTGFDSYAQGDLLAGSGNEGNPLIKLPLGENNQVLTVDTNHTSGMRWSTMSSMGTFPRGYIMMSDPFPVSQGPDQLRYRIEYCFARSQFDEEDIYINWRETLGTNNGGTNGICISTSEIGADATSSGDIVTFTTTNAFDHFIRGDVITINGIGRRIINIIDQYNLKISSPFPSDITIPTAFYWGGYAKNTTYYLYACKAIVEGEYTFFSLNTRCYASYNDGNAPMHLPQFTTVWRQLYPVFFTSNFDDGTDNGDRFRPFLYNAGKITGYMPTNIVDNQFYGINGFSRTYDSNVDGINVDLEFDEINFFPPLTMSHIYLQKTNNASLLLDDDSTFRWSDGNNELYEIDDIRLSSTDENTSIVVFCGGIVNMMNINGED